MTAPLLAVENLVVEYGAFRAVASTWITALRAIVMPKPISGGGVLQGAVAQI